MDDPVASLPTAGTWRETDPGRRYFTWLARHPGVENLPDLRAAWSEAWRQASWATLKSQSELGLRLLDLSQRIDALERHLQDMAAAEAYEAEIEQSSIYYRSRKPDEDAERWALSNANAEEHAIVGAEDDEA